MSSTSANILSCKIVLLSPTRFVRLAHTSSGSFTTQLKVPVYIAKKELNFRLNTKHFSTDLRIGTANLVVIRLGNRRENILEGVTYL